MEERKKIEDRKWFTKEEKDFIRSKSNNLCSHCGKKLSNDFTVEHVIPISKGGSNDMSNIVALCSDCNNAKDNYIYHPNDYYRFLLPQYLDELVFSQSRYYKEFDWLTPNSLLPEDIRELKVSIVVFSEGLKAHKSKSQCVNLPFATSSVYLKKAVYSDLDDIYKFYLKFMRKYIKPVSNLEEYVKNEITDWFCNGAIYFIVDKLNEIKIVIPMKFMGYSDDFSKSRNDEPLNNGVVPVFESPLILNDGVNYVLATIKAYTYILANLVKRLKRPVFFIMDSYNVTKTVIKSTDTVMYMCDCGYGINSYNDDGNMIKYVFTGKWSYSDEKMLDNSLLIDNIEPYLKDENELIYIKKCDSLERRFGGKDHFKLTNFDVDRYKEEMRVFSRNLARQFGYRSKDSRIEIVSQKNDNKSVIDEDKFSIIELPISDIKLPLSVSESTPISSFIKKQVKLNCVKHIEIDGSYTVTVEDAPILLYLKQLKVKNVACKIRKKYLIEEQDISEEDYDFINMLKEVQGHGDFTYSRVDVVLRQDCKCAICDSKFSSDNLPYNILKKPRRLGGKSENENVLATCKRCRNFVGNLSYSDELKNIILKEYELEKEFKNNDK